MTRILYNTDCVVLCLLIFDKLRTFGLRIQSVLRYSGTVVSVLGSVLAAGQIALPVAITMSYFMFFSNDLFAVFIITRRL